MRAPKRSHREPTHHWEQLRPLAAWPAQTVCELLRPIVLFGRTSAARAPAAIPRYAASPGRAAPMMRPMLSGEKNSEMGTVPAMVPKKRLVCS
jgi:hypothetical protein